jgi:caa(3)-type oxidase subunit IV
MAEHIESPEDIKKSIKKYLIIGGVLIFLSWVTVELSYVELPTHSQNILLGMIVATFKASLVALIFMHLNHERTLIYKILAFTVVFCIGLFTLFLFAKDDPLVFHGFYKAFE